MAIWLIGKPAGNVPGFSSTTVSKPMRWQISAFFINIPVGILAFFLVSRLVDDPPWIRADRSRLRHMDYLGLSFLALAMGGLQIMLDKGEENAWFASGFIRFFAILFIGGMIALVWWELRHKNPIINLRLFRRSQESRVG